MPKTVTTHIPRHVGFIMDGNRRWARALGKLPMRGHEAGEDALYTVLNQCFDQGVEYVSVYAFSTENWSRGLDEIKFLMALVPKALKKYLKEFHAKNIRIVVLGSRDKLPSKVVQAIDEAELVTKDNTHGTLAICFNYGGMAELADAIRAVVASGTDVGTLQGDDIQNYLYHPEIPPCDLVVRSSGEQRLSGFMLARSEYAEFIFEPKMWPDVTAADVDLYIAEYASRQRRLGA